jgi:hypothetical protein
MGGHKENTSTVLLAVCVLQALPRNGFTCHSIVTSWSDYILDSLIQRVTRLYNSLFHTHRHTRTHAHTSLCSVATSNGGRSPYSGFPNYPPYLSYQFLTISPTHQTTHSTSLHSLTSRSSQLVRLIRSRHESHCCSSVFALGTCVFAKPFLVTQ